MHYILRKKSEKPQGWTFSDPRLWLFAKIEGSLKTPKNGLKTDSLKNDIRYKGYGYWLK